MNTQTTQITTSVMTKLEAQEKHAQIIELSGQYIDRVGPIALEMREREGWVHSASRTGPTTAITSRPNKCSKRHALSSKGRGQQNVQSALRMRHALVLARLPSPEAQQEVFEKVKKDFVKPLERNYEPYVDRWFRDHDKANSKGANDVKGGLALTEVEEDSELSDALNRIEKVYGPRPQSDSRRDDRALAQRHYRAGSLPRDQDERGSLPYRGEPLGRAAGDEVHQHDSWWRHDHSRVAKSLPFDPRLLLHLLSRRVDIPSRRAKRTFREARANYTRVINSHRTIYEMSVQPMHEKANP